MKKATLLIAVFAAFLISLSAVFDGSEAPIKGNRAPSFELSNGFTTVNLDEMRGKYVLLNFWKSSEADSRMKCNQYARILEESDINYVSVNLDGSEVLYHEILKRDGLDSKTQYHAKDSEVEYLCSAFGLADGMKSFLISPDGTILAINPDPNFISERINS